MNPKPEYLLLIRGTQWDKSLSPEEIQNIMNRVSQWCDRLSAEGKLQGARPLEARGKLITGKTGQIVTDGPFAESKEAVGGYFLISVDDEEEAIALARSHPLLELGLTVEVRPMAAECELMKQAREAALAI